MEDRLPIPRSPKGIAAAYGLFSALWVVASDWIVHLLVDDPTLVTGIQTIKGWLFIVGSALLLYVLVSHSRRDLERANERLDRALTQSSILQRLLRHNLRNTCNVIAGNAALLEERIDDDAAGPLRTIQGQTERLVSLGEKTGTLRRILLEDPDDGRELDLASVVASVVERTRSRYPDAEIRTNVPERVPIVTDPSLEVALDELLENAIVHDDDPRVDIDVTADGDWTTIEVRDTGPGIPAVERAALEKGVETPIVHSEGLGLWIAHIVATRAGGDLDIGPNERGGTTVRIRLPS